MYFYNGKIESWYKSMRRWSDNEFNNLPKSKKNGLFIFYDGDKLWFKNGEFHRVNGPAVICFDGDKYWYVDGKLHRLDGPAIEYYDGVKLYFIRDKEYSYKEWKKLSFAILNNLDVFL